MIGSEVVVRFGTIATILSGVIERNTVNRKD
jgi:hypothetical protein